MKITVSGFGLLDRFVFASYCFSILSEVNASMEPFFSFYFVTNYVEI